MIFTCEFSFRRKSDIRIPRKPAWAVLHLPSSYRPQRRYYQRVRVYTQHRCVWQNMYLSMWGGPGEILRMMLLVLLLLLCSLSPAGQPGDPLTAWSHVPLLCPRPQGSLLTEDHPQPHSPATSLTHVPSCSLMCQTSLSSGHLHKTSFRSTWTSISQWLSPDLSI